MLDPIAEMLNKIKTAQRAGKEEVMIAPSRLKLAIAKILEKEGFVESVSEEKTGRHNEIRVRLKYYRVSQTEKNPAIQEIKRCSREGQRIYVNAKGIGKIKNNFGLAIVSTSQGVMSGAAAKKAGLGGEYICEVW